MAPSPQLRGFGKRGDVVAVGGSGIGAGGEEQFDRIEVIVVRGPEQRGHAGDVGGVHVQLSV